MQVQTAGMFKQDFIVKRVLNEEITIRPNIRIQRAIIDHLDGLTAELKWLEKIDPDSYVLENIRYLLELIAKLNPRE